MAPLPDHQRMRLNIFVKIPYSELQFTRLGKQYQARYQLDMVVRGADEERIAGKVFKGKLLVSTYQEARHRHRWAYFKHSFIVKAQKIKVEIRATDLFTHSANLKERTLDFSQLYQQPVALGSIILAAGRKDTLGPKSLVFGNALEMKVDTLFFRIPILASGGPYHLRYKLLHSNEALFSQDLIIPEETAIDSSLTLPVPMKTLPYAEYQLRVKFTNASGASVVREQVFQVRLEGIKFNVGDLDEAIKQLRYIASPGEIQRMLKAPLDEKRVMFREFWKKKDPSPNTPENELMDEYYRRVAYTIENFSSVRVGWKTDRGMVYIIFGPPDEVEKGPFELDRKPYEIWHYFRLGRKFLFVDETGFGDYRLVNPSGEIQNWRFRY